MMRVQAVVYIIFHWDEPPRDLRTCNITRKPNLVNYFEAFGGGNCSYLKLEHFEIYFFKRTAVLEKSLVD